MEERDKKKNENEIEAINCKLFKLKFLAKDSFSFNLKQAQAQETLHYTVGHDHAFHSF